MAWTCYSRVCPPVRARSLLIVQSNAGEPDAAIAGVHYVAFDNSYVASRMVMPANEVVATIPIIMTRTSERILRNPA